MRPFNAWLLLSIISFQWIGGYISVKFIYSIELERQMSVTEKKLAELVAAEVGMDTYVKILDDVELAARGAGYGTFFPFSQKMDSTTVYYLIESDKINIIDKEFIVHNATRNTTDKIAPIKRLFSIFTVQDDGFHLKTLPIHQSTTNFSTQKLTHIFYPSILTPPPKFV